MTKESDAIEQAKTAAFRLLRYRLRSERELLTRLRAKGWDKELVKAFVETQKSQ